MGRMDPQKARSSEEHVFRESAETWKVKLRWAQTAIKKLGLRLRCVTRSC